MPDLPYDKIYLHCSVSAHGNENIINHWHRLRKFGTMVRGYHLSTGYHEVVLNGCPHGADLYIDYLDGSIETARAYDVQGAGVKGDNKGTLHICLIGRPGEFTKAQMQSLFEALSWHVRRGIKLENVWGHYEYWTKQGLAPMKSCPGLDMDKLRTDLAHYMQTGRLREQQTAQLELARSKLKALLDIINSMMGGSIG